MKTLDFSQNAYLHTRFDFENEAAEKAEKKHQTPSQFAIVKYFRSLKIYWLFVFTFPKNQASHNWEMRKSQ